MASLAVAFCSPASDVAQIVNSGSTNTPGWTISIRSDGSGSALARTRGGAKAQPASFSIQPALADAFFKDLEAARTANSPGGRCMKSASFGSTTRAQWHGWTSADLTCAGDDPALAALARDAEAIVEASGVAQQSRGGFGPGGGAPIPIST